jgi:DNA primase
MEELKKSAWFPIGNKAIRFDLLSEVISMGKGKYWVEYKEIKEKVSLAAVLERYGVLNKLKLSGQNSTGACPIHNGTNPRQFSACLERGIWKCFGDCDDGGNVLDFVALKEFGSKDANSIRKAALLLKKWFFLPQTEENPVKVDAPLRPEKENVKCPESAPINQAEPHAGPANAAGATGQKNENKKTNPPLKFALKLDPEHPWFAERGFSQDTIQAFGLGFCSKGLMSGRIAIPIRDRNGDLVAYCGRAVTDEQVRDEGKYLLPPKFHKQEVVYNLDRMSPEVKQLVVVESYLSVWRLHEAGYGNAVALMGASLGEAQERLILEFLGPLGQAILLFDPDEAGMKCGLDAIVRLGRRLFAKLIDLSAVGKKPHQLSREEFENLL